MANKSKPRGLKVSKRELRNREEDARRREPLLQDEEVAKQERDRRLQANAAWHPDRVPEGTRIWTSNESTDLDKLVKGETSIDWSKGTWSDDVGKVMKTEPNLIDQLLHSKHDLTGIGTYDIPRLKLLQAQRFLLDAPASRFFGEVTMAFGLQALRNHELARAPYELSWVEFDSRAYASVVPSSAAPYEEDERVAYFYDHGTVNVAASSTRAEVMPYRFLLNTPVSQAEEEDICHFFRLSQPIYRMFLMGSLDNRERTDLAFWTSPEVVSICRAHRLEIHPKLRKNLDDAKAPDDIRHRLVTSSAGILKQVILLLLLLTRPNKHVYFGEASVKAQRVWLKNRQVPMVSHTKVTMHLQQKDVIRKLFDADPTGRHHKHHDVRGHWCESRKKGRECRLQHGTHQWAMLDKDHGECSYGCGAKLWWKAKHERGDIALGSTSKTYTVTE